MKHWISIKERTPTEGMPVVILDKNGEGDPDFWTTDIAYCCDGEFYTLELDPNLGVLRKMHVNYPVEYWSKYISWDITEIKELYG